VNKFIPIIAIPSFCLCSLSLTIVVIIETTDGQNVIPKTKNINVDESNKNKSLYYGSWGNGIILAVIFLSFSFSSVSNVFLIKLSIYNCNDN